MATRITGVDLLAVHVWAHIWHVLFLCTERRKRGATILALSMFKDIHVKRRSFLHLGSFFCFSQWIYFGNYSLYPYNKIKHLPKRITIIPIGQKFLTLPCCGRVLDYMRVVRNGDYSVGDAPHWGNVTESKILHFPFHFALFPKGISVGPVFVSLAFQKVCEMSQEDKCFTFQDTSEFTGTCQGSRNMFNVQRYW